MNANSQTFNRSVLNRSETNVPDRVLFRDYTGWTEPQGGIWERIVPDKLRDTGQPGI